MKKWICQFVFQSVACWYFLGWGIGLDTAGVGFWISLSVFLLSFITFFVMLKNRECISKDNRRYLGAFGGVIFVNTFLVCAWVKLSTSTFEFSWRYIALTVGTIGFGVLSLMLIAAYRKYIKSLN